MNMTSPTKSSCWSCFPCCYKQEVKTINTPQSTVTDRPSTAAPSTVVDRTVTFAATRTFIPPHTPKNSVQMSHRKLQSTEVVDFFTVLRDEVPKTPDEEKKQ